MDDDGLNMRNWGYYEPSFKEHFGLQLLSPLGDHRDAKSFVSSRENPFMINPNATATATAYHHQPSLPMHYIRDSWIQRERLLHIIPGSPNLALLQDDLGSNSAQVMQPIEPLNYPKMNVDDSGGGGDGDGGDGDGGDGDGALKKRSVAAATSRGKKPKKVKENRKPPGGRSKVVKWNLDVVINGVDMDISGIPIPVCSCTGAPQQCYRWGSGGWQSACCTTTISMYPLPMSTKRRGARIAGRKMSQGAFKKVLEKLGSEGYDFANAIDLRTHWAKHGTNKFVTIR